MKKLLFVFLLSVVPVAAQATCVGAAPGTCTQQAIGQALQNSQTRNQQLYNLTAPQNTPAIQQYQQNQSQIYQRSFTPAPQQQMMMDFTNRMEQRRQQREMMRLYEQGLEEQRRHNAYTEMQRDSERSFMIEQAQEAWDRRKNPCIAYHHEGYLGGPEQPDSITVYDRNCQ